MKEERKKELLEELNKKCEECRKKYGNPTFDHCNYHCAVGNQIHKLDFEAKGGWGSHGHWKN